MLSILPINLVELLALGWQFYNSKSFKVNKLGSSFRRRVFIILRAFIKAFYLAQWLDPLLTALHLKILLLAAKTSLLQLLQPKAITAPLCHVLSLLLLLYWLFLLCLPWPNTWKMTFSGSLGPFWILDLQLLLRLLHQLFKNTKAFVKDFKRPDS